MGNVGGDPGVMTGGASQLHSVGTALRSAQQPLASAATALAGAAGDAALSDALARYGVAWSTMADDTGTQLLSAAQLAAHAAQDLTAAGGGGH